MNGSYRIVKGSYILLHVILWLAFMFSSTSGVDAMSAGNACTTERLQSFFKKFEDDKRLQMQRTKLPLKYVFVDAASIKLEEHTMYVNNFFEIPFVRRCGGSLVPPKALRKSDRLAMSIGNENTISLAQPGTDYILLYEFVRQNNCWFLTKIYNPTL